MKKYTLENGKDVKLDCNFLLLKKLQNEDPDLFKRVNRSLADNSGERDIFVMSDFLYGAYVMANPKKSERMTEDEFLEQLGFNIEQIGGVYAFLLGQDPKALSATRS